MRKLALVAAALLAACSTPPAEPPMHGLVPGQVCDATSAEHFIGQDGTSDTGAAIMRATHSSVLRWAPPGTMLTMDYSPSRVTVRLGPDRKVTAINCG